MYYKPQAKKQKAFIAQNKWKSQRNAGSRILLSLGLKMPAVKNKKLDEDFASNSIGDNGC